MSDKENTSLHDTVDNSSPSPDRSAFKTRLARFSYLATKTAKPTKQRKDTRDGNDKGDGRKRKRQASRSIPAAEPVLKKSQTAKMKLASEVKTTSKTAAQSLTRRIPNNLVDSLSPGLPLVMCGVNPGLETARTGHAYAHPSNRYWPIMHEAGVTPIRHRPSETHSLQELYGIGHTNIVSHPTRTEAEITRQEYLAGAAELEAKIRVFRPKVVAIVGKGIWETWVEYRTGARMGTAAGRRRLRELGLREGFEYGWQEEKLWIGRTGAVDEQGNRDEGVNESWNGARTIVVTTTSGVAARFARDGGAERLRIWRPLGEWFEPLREEWIRKREQQQQIESGEGVKTEDNKDETETDKDASVKSE